MEAVESVRQQEGSMGKRANGYGSEDHFWTYRTEREDALDREVLKAVGLRGALVWTYPDPTHPEAKEPKGMNFCPDPALREAWKTFWPQTGNQQRWDGIAQIGDQWLLMEGKANHAEFVGGPCGASFEKAVDPGAASSRQMIEKALNQTKKALGVHRDFSWLGSYYQYANRLAALEFLTERGIPARLLFIHFCGDSFPDGRPCPATRRDWEPLIEARRLTLGLPVRHALADRVHEVFLNVPISTGG
jgi:hypothetical protein